MSGMNRKKAAHDKFNQLRRQAEQLMRKNPVNWESQPI
jgi:hypothetical protein